MTTNCSLYAVSMTTNYHFVICFWPQPPSNQFDQSLNFDVFFYLSLKPHEELFIGLFQRSQLFLDWCDIQLCLFLCLDSMEIYQAESTKYIQYYPRGFPVGMIRHLERIWSLVSITLAVLIMLAIYITKTEILN